MLLGFLLTEIISIIAIDINLLCQNYQENLKQEL